MGTDYTPRDPASVLRDIRGKSSVIGSLKAERDAGKFKSAGAALGLQIVENQRKALRSQLPPLALVHG